MCAKTISIQQFQGERRHRMVKRIYGVTTRHRCGRHKAVRHPQQTKIARNFAKKGSPRAWRDDTRCLHQTSWRRNASLCAPVARPAKRGEPSAPRRRGPPAAMATPGWFIRASKTKTDSSRNQGGLTKATDVGLVSGRREAGRGCDLRCRPPHGVGQKTLAARTS